VTLRREGRVASAVLMNTAGREEFRHASVISTVAGFGFDSCRLGFLALVAQTASSE